MRADDVLIVATTVAMALSFVFDVAMAFQRLTWI